MSRHALQKVIRQVY